MAFANAHTHANNTIIPLLTQRSGDMNIVNPSRHEQFSSNSKIGNNSSNSKIDNNSRIFGSNQEWQSQKDYNQSGIKGSELGSRIQTDKINNPVPSHAVGTSSSGNINCQPSANFNSQVCNPAQLDSNRDLRSQVCNPTQLDSNRDPNLNTERSSVLLSEFRRNSRGSQPKIMNDTKAEGTIISVGNNKMSGGSNILSSEYAQGLMRMHGRCGILTACLVDPLSQLINKICGLREDDVNSVGFYYEAELHGMSKCTVILFNIYDNDPIPWLRLGYTMDLLLSSPFVTKITYYPLITSDNETQHGSLLTRDMISKRSAALSEQTPKGSKKQIVPRRLEETFRITVIQTISMNAKAVHDKNTSYTALLLKIAGITGEEADRLSGLIITGYSLVNKVLLTLMGVDKADLNKISSSIIPCPLIRKPVSIVAPKDKTGDDDVRYIIEDSRREITKLVAVFVDLFTTHDEFRANILASRSNKQINPTTRSELRFDPNNFNSLNKLMNHEFELVSHITGGLQNGLVSNQIVTEIIHDLMNERFNLGNYQQLPVCCNPKSSVQVSSESVMCTFQQSTNLVSQQIGKNIVRNGLSMDNLMSLRDLGEYLSHIAESFNDKDVLTINLGGIIETYNNAVKGTNISEISLPRLGTPNTLSRSAIVTIPGNSGVSLSENNKESSGTMLNVPITDSSQVIAVPMYNSNLTVLTEAQLIDILVYIDSLRSSDGTFDTRFVNLQNEITRELAQRKRVESK
ncbi:Hypothetical protein HVR_LOCUS1307 [uncultured virus]|nr:Hypothetical protein HVR_LOCUS1307 [uncultured virus]